MPVSKVVLNDVVKLDLTADTVSPETLAEGVTAHDAAGNQITGTMKMGITSTKVWENARPTSSFAEQTIALDLTEFDAVIIKWETNSDSWYPVFQKVNPTDLIPVGSKKSCIAVLGSSLATSNDAKNLCLRSVSVDTSGVRFYEGNENNVYNGGTTKFGSTRNALMVPLAIYGIKGVFPA